MGITGYIKKSSFVWKIHQPTTTTAETKKHISDFVESTFKKCLTAKIFTISRHNLIKVFISSIEVPRIPIADLFYDTKWKISAVSDVCYGFKKLKNS